MLGHYDYDAFVTLMRTGVTPEQGAEALPPMNLMPQYGKNCTDVELRALWTFLKCLEPHPSGT